MEVLCASAFAIFLVVILSWQFKRKQFSWTEKAKDDLLNCYIQARQTANGQKGPGPLCFQFFQALYPDENLSQTVVKNEINRLKRERPELFFDESTETLSQGLAISESSQVSTTAKRHNWTEERELRLWQLASHAFSIEDLRQLSQHYKGLRQRPSGFFSILHELYVTDQRLQEGELSEGALRQKFYRVIEKFGPIEPAPEHSPDVINAHTATNALSRARRDLEQFSSKPIFDACCSICGSFLYGDISRGHKFHQKAQSSDCLALKRFEGYNDLLATSYQNQRSEVYHYYCGSCFQRKVTSRPFIPEMTEFFFYDPVSKTAKRAEPLFQNNLELPQAVKNQLSLVRFDYNVTKRSVPRRQSYHINRGYVTLKHKTHQEYYGMYGFLTVNAKNARDHIKVDSQQTWDMAVKALKWLRENNRLFKYFFANMETMFGFCNAAKSLINFYTIPGQENLGDQIDHGKEATLLHVPSRQGMPTMMDPDQSYIGLQHPKPNSDQQEIEKNLASFTFVNHFDANKENKAFPWLYPFGKGGFCKKRGVRRSEFVKQKLLCVDRRWAKDLLWCYYQNNEHGLDIYYHTLHNNVASNKVRDNPLTCGDILDGFKEEEYAVGRPMLNAVVGTKEYWRMQTFNLLALKDFMDRKRGQTKGHPDFFLTLTLNESWPEVQAYVRSGPRGNPSGTKQYKEKLSKGGDPATYDVTAVTVAAQKRLNFVLRKIREDKPLGDIEEFFVRAEYQNRGAIHWHILLWCKPGTVPKDCVTAEVPCGDQFDGELWETHRRKVISYQTHNCVKGKCQPQQGGKCKLGFPFGKNDTLQLDSTGKRYLYIRRNPRDQYIVPYNRFILEWLDGHHNLQYVSESSWISYLVKYTTKAFTYNVKLPGKQAVVTVRDIPIMEANHASLQYQAVQCSREVIYLPTDLDPDEKVVKPKHMLEKQDRESEDVFYQTKIQKYLQRPNNLRDISYANFYRHYDFRYKQGKAELVERGREAIVRWNLKYIMKSPEDYAMQQLILNVPFQHPDGADLFSSDNPQRDPITECICRRDDYPDIKFGSEKEMALHFLETTRSKGFKADQLMLLVHELQENGYLDSEICQDYLERLEQQKLQEEEDLRDYAITTDVLDHEEILDMNITSEDVLTSSFKRTASKGQFFIYEKLLRWTKGEKQKVLRDTNYKKTQNLIFITGGAGVGKTYLTRMLMATFKMFNVPHQAVAYTGIASRVAGGTTIHNFFQLSLRLKTRLDPSSIQADIIRNCEVLIIDEVSMLPSSLFHVINQIFKNYRNKNCNQNLHFGGRSIILIGDPAQLPVIKGKCIWYEPLFYEHFDVYNLTEIKRTTERDFQSILNTLRQGVVTKEADEFLQMRTVNEDLLSNPEIFKQSAVFVCSLTKDRDAFNEKIMNALEGDEECYPSIDYRSNGEPLDRKEAQRYAKKSKTMLPDELRLKIGCRVILLKNLETRRGWVNGTLAIVRRMYRDYITVCDAYQPTNEKVLLRYEEDISPRNEPGVAYRCQFPIAVAYALTIHKTQGLTIPEIYVDMKFAWESGQIYVALSRCNTSRGLHIVNYDKKKIIINPYFRDILTWIGKNNLLSDRNQQLLSKRKHPRELEENRIPVPMSKKRAPKPWKSRYVNIYHPDPEDEESNSSSSNGCKTPSDTELPLHPTQRTSRRKQKPEENPNSSEEKNLISLTRRLFVSSSSSSDLEMLEVIDDNDLNVDMLIDNEPTENINLVRNYTETQLSEELRLIAAERNIEIRDLSQKSVMFLKYVRKLLIECPTNSAFEERMINLVEQSNSQSLSKRISKLLINCGIKRQRLIVEDTPMSLILQNQYHYIWTSAFFVEKTPGYGDCFYCAVSQLLLGTPIHFHMIRAGCLFAYFRQMTMFKRYLDLSNPLRRENTWWVCMILASKGEWATNDQMAMAALLTLRPYQNINVKPSMTVEPRFEFPKFKDTSREAFKQLESKSPREVESLIVNADNSVGGIFGRLERIYPWTRTEQDRDRIEMRALDRREPLTVLFHENHFCAMVPKVPNPTLKLCPNRRSAMCWLTYDETIAEARYIYECTEMDIFELNLQDEQ